MATLDAVANRVRIKVPGCPEPIIRDAIIQAARDFCEQTRAITQEFTLVTAANVALNDLAAYLTAGTRAVRIEYVERDVNPYGLFPSSKPEFEENSDLRQSGDPQKFYLDNNAIVLGPIPYQVENLSCSVAIVPTEDATTIPDVLDNDWRLAIAAGAAALLLSMPKQSWADINAAAIEAATFQAGIDRAIKRRDIDGTTGRVRSYPSWC